jgi:hypothetical protein
MDIAEGVEWRLHEDFVGTYSPSPESEYPSKELQLSSMPSSKSASSDTAGLGRGWNVDRGAVEEDEGFFGYLVRGRLLDLRRGVEGEECFLGELLAFAFIAAGGRPLGYMRFQSLLI